MIKPELAIFLVVGATTVLVDFVSYRGLIRFGGMDVGIAKAAGFLIGTLFAYYANRYWTFGHKSHAQGAALRFVVLYTSTLGANVIINSLVLKLIGNEFAAIQLAFLISTVVSASINFIGMKAFVFRQRPTTELQ